MPKAESAGVSGRGRALFRLRSTEPRRLESELPKGTSSLRSTVRRKRDPFCDAARAGFDSRNRIEKRESLYATAARLSARCRSFGRPKAVSMACRSAFSGTKTTTPATSTRCRVAGSTGSHVSPDRRWKSAMNSTGNGVVPVQVPKIFDRNAACADPCRSWMPIVGRMRCASAMLNSTSTSATWPGSAPCKATAALAIIHHGSRASTMRFPTAPNDAKRGGLTVIRFQ